MITQWRAQTENNVSFWKPRLTRKNNGENDPPKSFPPKNLEEQKRAGRERGQRSTVNYISSRKRSTAGNKKQTKSRDINQKNKKIRF